MNSNAPSFKRSSVLYVIGYLIAVPVAVVVTTLVWLVPTVFPDQGRFGSFYREMEVVGVMITVGLAYTGVTALPGYVLTLIVAAKNNLHAQWYYVTCGVLTAMLAHLLLGLFVGYFASSELRIYIGSLFGGAAGAFAYFLYRRKMLSLWS